MMIGGDKAVVDRLDPIFKTLAPGIGDIERTKGRDGRDPRIEQGYIHAGPVGAGHFVKMVHNGIEYGLMQAYAEGFDILKNANIDALPAEHRFDLDVADIAEVWRRGSVIPSWLLDLTATALAKNPTLDEYSGFVEDSGEGRWTVNAAIDEAVPAEVLTAALFARFRSRKEHTFAEKILSAMRAGFGGHKEPKQHGEQGTERQTATSRPPRRNRIPAAFVIFGVTGDLAHRLVMPALYNLAANELFPDKFCVVGIARKATSNEDLRDSLMKGLRQFATRKVDDKIAERLLECVTSIAADPKRSGLVRQHAQAARRARSARANRRQPAVLSGDAAQCVRPDRQAARPHRHAGGERRVAAAGGRKAVRHRSGIGQETQRRAAASSLDENQIYRIDHYLGKETVQNILVLRFANGMFEPIWNRNHIDHIQITVDEKLGVGHRGSFYDATGALRDMVPNHLFQLLSLVAMEPPARFDAACGAHRKGRSAGGDPDPERSRGAEEFGARPVSRRQDRRHRDRGLSQDRGRQARQHHRNLCRAEIDHRQLALGRRSVLPAHRQGARRQAHRESRSSSSRRRSRCSATPRWIRSRRTILVIGVEPTEGITLQFNTKMPGPAIAIDGVEMKFRYKDYFKAEPSTGYETLIYDCMIGDNILFQRADSVEAGWPAVQPFLDAWKKAGAKGLKTYKAGSEGPAEADDLLARDGRNWRQMT